MSEELENQPELPKINKKKSPGGAIWAILIIIFIGCISISLPIGILGFSLYSIRKQAAQMSTATPVSLPDWPAAFSEDFSKASGTWQTDTFSGKDYEDTRSIERGKYVWTVSSQTGYTFFEVPKIGNFSDFYITVDANHNKGSVRDGYGIIFRYAQNNYYFFAVRDDQTFSVSSYYLGNWETLINNGKVSVLSPGEINTLGVLGEGDHYQFFINNVRVGKLVDNSLSTGAIGLAINPWSGEVPPDPKQQGISFSTLYKINSQIEFDNFQILAPADSQLKPSPLVQLPPIIPTAGHVVFASNRNGDRNIYLINSDGSDLKQITDDPSEDYAPKWSPDGKKIVFVSDRDGDPNIYVMDADGKNVIRLTSNLGDDFSPDWSPDGKKIVYVSVRDNIQDLYIMDSRNGDETLSQLTNKNDLENFPNWSGENNSIAFQATSLINGSTVIQAINDDGKQQKILVNYDKSLQPTWSPDGKLIAYVYEEIPSKKTIVETYNPETQEFFVVSEKLNIIKTPAWSPDGSQIIFASGRDGQYDLYIMPAAGNGMFRLTHNEAVEESPDWFSGN